MSENPILEEIYAAREKLLADAGGDVHKYLEGVRKREQASGLLRDPNNQRTSKDLTSRHARGDSERE
jgi:hypothetical protein